MVRRVKDWAGSGEDQANTVKQSFRRTYRLREFERILNITLVSLRSNESFPTSSQAQPLFQTRHTPNPASQALQTEIHLSSGYSEYR